MKYIEAVSRINILSLVPVEGLDDEARAAVTLNIVSCEGAVAAFEEEMRKVADKYKSKGFDDKMAKFGLAIAPPEKPTEKQTKEIKKLRADPDFEAFCKEYEDVDRKYVEARRQAMETRELEVCEYPLTKQHLAAISRVLPAGGKVTQRKADGSVDRELDNQAVFVAVVAIAHKQK